MLWTVALILAVFWLLGLLTGTTMGGLIHFLLVVSLIIIVLNLFTGRRRV